MTQKKQTEENPVSEENQNIEEVQNVAESAEEINPELELTENSESAETGEDEAQKKYDELEKKYETLRNDYLRLMAEFDNYRKRTLKEKADLTKNGGEECLKKILPVVDDFERAIGALEASNDINAVKEGIEHIYNKFQNYLDNNGVVEIPAVGENFNDEVHEAITTFPAQTPEQKGKVIDCMTKGYKLNDKVIRFSKVVVGE